MDDLVDVPMRDGFVEYGIVTIPEGQFLMRLCNTRATIPVTVQYLGPISLRVTWYGISGEYGDPSRKVTIEGWFRFRRRRTLLEWIRRFPREQCEEVGAEIRARIECYPYRERGPKGVMYVV